VNTAAQAPSRLATEMPVEGAKRLRQDQPRGLTCPDGIAGLPSTSPAIYTRGSEPGDGRTTAPTGGDSSVLANGERPTALASKKTPGSGRPDSPYQ
jgi:hypothetical protein